MKHKNKTLKIQAKKLIKGFTSTKITQYSGLSSLMPFIVTKLKLADTLNDIFPTKATNALKFSTSQILMAVILSSLSGLNRVSKISNFTTDILIQTLLNLKSSISNQTLIDRIKSLGIGGCFLLTELILDKGTQILRKSKLTTITLDVDSSVIPVCGKQEGAEVGFNSSAKKVRSYHPLIAFISELKIVYNSWFRTGSAYTANGISDFILQISEKIPETVEQVFFRADSGFFNGKLFDLLEELKYTYLVKVKLYSNIKEMLKTNNEWQNVDGAAGVSICEIEYKGSKWKTKRTLKAVRIFKGYKEVYFFDEKQYEAQYDYFCYCSNLDLNSYELHLNYAQRATSETWIEQVKSHLKGGSTVIDNFNANDIFWQLSVLAYNISVMARFKWKRFFREEHNTFKDWFINVPAILIKSGRRVFLKIYKNYNYKERWKVFDGLLLDW